APEVRRGRARADPRASRSPPRALAGSGRSQRVAGPAVRAADLHGDAVLARAARQARRGARVVMSATAGTGMATALPSEAASRLVWHDLECGGYEADLALWRELAGAPPEPVLEVGAGAGRVSLDLARAGHAVTALDHDRALLSAIESRRGDAVVQTAHADARSFSLRGRKFGLCVVPMHTIQLLRDRDERAAFLRCARAHMRRGGLLACAILTTVEPFDCRDGGLGPAADRANVGGLLYVSRPVRVEVRHGKIVIERERRILGPRDGPGSAGGGEGE